MRSVIKFFILFCIISQNIFAQSGWIKYDIGDSQPLQTFFFVNELTGYAASINHFYNFSKTTNGGVNWNIISYGGQWDETDGLHFFNEFTGFRTYRSGLQKTTDGGVNWSYVTIQNRFAYDLKFINNNTGFCSGRGLNKTTDGGNTWFTVLADDSLQFFMSFNFVDNNTGYASGTNNTRGIIYKTTDCGTTWNLINTGINGKYFYSPSFLNAFTGYILADSGNYPAHLYKTTNGGISWQEKATGFISSELFKISIINNNIAYALGQKSLIKTTDGGNNFFVIYQPENSNGYLTGLEFRNSVTGFVSGRDSITFVAKTINGGVFVKQISSEIPDHYSLTQNYPNPFNPSTRINYELKITNYVTLKVFDMLGKEVATLVNEKQNAGSYAVDFNSAEFNLPSGIYFYTLNAGEFKETRKMILIK